MRRFAFVLVATAALVAALALNGSAADQGYTVRNCSQGAAVCTEVVPSSSRPGSDDPMSLHPVSIASANAKTLP